MSMHDTDLDRYCPLRTDSNGEMRKCVKGCAWWWNGSCSVTRISYHLEMLQSGLDISPIITHRLPIAEFRDGFEIMRSGQSGKVILDWAA